MRSYQTLVFSALLSLSCAICGPAYPKKNGRAYLVEHGGEPEVIDAIVNQSWFAPAVFRKYKESRSWDVRYLIASNPHLTAEQLEFMLKDSHDFVRSGAANNRSLSKEQAEILSADDSPTVLGALAENPAMSTAFLRRLYLQSKDKIGLWNFASNPHCPEEIREEIRRSDDRLAKEILAESPAAKIPANE